MKSTTVAGALLVCVMASAATAQEGRSGPWFYGLQAAALYQGKSDLDEGTGHFSITRLFVQPSVGYAFDRRNRVSLSLGLGQNNYDFGGGAQLGGDEPWKRIRDFRVSTPIFFAATDKVTGIVIPSIRWNTETGADLDDGRTQGVLAGASYRFSEDFSIGPGLGWFSQLGDGSSVFPILLIDWNVTEKLNLSTGQGLAASQGPGLTLRYSLRDDLKLGLTGRYEKVRFRLDDSGPARDGIGQDTSFPLVASVEYTPSPTFSASAFAGAEFGGELRLRDHSGDTLTKSDYDPAPVLGFTLRARY
jgi:hypothetical protein